MHNSKIYPCIAGIICDVIACCTLFRIFDRSEDGALLGPWLIPWLLLSLCCFCANRLFLRRSRTLPAVILFDGLLIATHLAVVLCWCSTLHSLASYIMAALFVGFTAIRALSRCFYLPDALNSIRQLEACLAIFLFAAWFQALMVLNPDVLLPALVAVAVGFSAVLAQRLEGARYAASSGGRGFGAVGLVLVALALMMVLFMLFFSAPLGEGVLWVWNAGVAAVRWVLRLLYQILLWFFSLFPESEPGELIEFPPYSLTTPEEESGAEASPLLGAILMILMIGGLIALGLRVLWLLRKNRVGGLMKTTATRQRVSRTRPRLLSLLRRVMSAVFTRLRLWWRMLRLRNTPAGVCASIERTGLLLGAGRKRGETHGAYLRRVSELVEGHCPQTLPEQLQALAVTLERGFYAHEPMPPMQGGDATALRRSTRTALQRRLLPDADTFARIKGRISFTRH